MQSGCGVRIMALFVTSTALRKFLRLAPAAYDSNTPTLVFIVLD